MNTIEHRAIMILVFVMVAFNTVFLSANGLFMLVAPMPWYNLVPGVTDTGFFNQHFIRDIGIIQCSSAWRSGSACSSRHAASNCGVARPCG